MHDNFNRPRSLSQNRINAKGAAAAVAAERAAPDSIELLFKRLDQRRFVCDDAILEVALALRLRAHARARQVRASKPRPASVDDHALEVHARTQHALQAFREARIAVEVLAEVRPRLLRMDEPHLHATSEQPRENAEERLHLGAARLDVHVLDVRSRDPEAMLRPRHGLPHHTLVDLAIGNEGGHWALTMGFTH